LAFIFLEAGGRPDGNGTKEKMDSAATAGGNLLSHVLLFSVYHGKPERQRRKSLISGLGEVRPHPVFTIFESLRGRIRSKMGLLQRGLSHRYSCNAEQ
jgi:hypothetical protein